MDLQLMEQNHNISKDRIEHLQKIQDQKFVVLHQDENIQDTSIEHSKLVGNTL